LSQGFAELPGFRLAEPTEANAVFVEIAPERAEELEKRGWVFYGGTHFYPPELPHRYRFMCSWQTTEAMVDELLRDAAADS
jgi:threonine aldolase